MPDRTPLMLRLRKVADLQATMLSEHTATQVADMLAVSVSTVTRRAPGDLNAYTAKDLLRLADECPELAAAIADCVQPRPEAGSAIRIHGDLTASLQDLGRVVSDVGEAVGKAKLSSEQRKRMVADVTILRGDLDRVLADVAAVDADERARA